ncbi:MAG: TraR/DksA family transcriptional regulator [Deltaproteobacteria bacterium]|nr:TraR/DksA family transcriptional regulator [Deltaproteobacteria bacterium]
MAGGWTRDGGVQEQIDASMEDAVKLARNRLPGGEGSTLCISCQSEIEKRQTTPAGFNRRGSKDSQLK